MAAFLAVTLKVLVHFRGGGMLLYISRNCLKRQTKTAADDILIFYFYLSKKVRLDVSSESSA